MPAVVRSKWISLAGGQPWFRTRTPDILQPDSSSCRPITARITFPYHYIEQQFNNKVLWIAIGNIMLSKAQPYVLQSTKSSPSSTTCGPTGAGSRKSKLTTSHTSICWRPGVITHSPPSVHCSRPPDDHVCRSCWRFHSAPASGHHLKIAMSCCVCMS